MSVRGRRHTIEQNVVQADASEVAEMAGEREAPGKRPVADRLQSLIAKIKLQSQDFADLDIRVYPALVPGNPHVIDISKKRFSRRVTVDARKAKRLETDLLDPELMRDLRSAMISVARLAKERK
jgi:hypothetical protein